ncbi:hypothetical protein A2454_03645 [Candidatus Peribacteria bacterium RIFOXYC2_FULL_55_14]|nr:MAG: hypothetical protein UY85_C0036G0008 [Candidatus Peribacteria bacterium GW2011_GWB1_54_5]KKW38562.1 MAG: hypothetical protein UY87_C0069G0008 [Candidatus Peribacteria bacterium GW2011_GWC2_54_8]OGJ71494.1 MAG: hypothetical protein A2198_04790 [Candidatus Peribacteria bacterium RIFOXYA1_FULL_56_14]OGJ72887.1 MAG: hypothetical protein A2217_06305 [Candidatus Peribacteria bacterium RIFOXYA2_FULL_55_28]OGJ74821.1 MAG: hypothetical protein A2384_02065 [Candidatus Peribacteria bacterium RIFOX
MRIFAGEPDLDEDGVLATIPFERPTREPRVDMREFRLDLYRAIQEIDHYLACCRRGMCEDILSGERYATALCISMVIALPRSVRYEHHALRGELENRKHPTPLENIPGTWALPVQDLSVTASTLFPALNPDNTPVTADVDIDPMRLQELRSVLSDAVGNTVIGLEDEPEKPSSKWALPGRGGDHEPSPPAIALTVG